MAVNNDNILSFYPETAGSTIAFPYNPTVFDDVDDEKKAAITPNEHLVRTIAVYELNAAGANSRRHFSVISRASIGGGRHTAVLRYIGANNGEILKVHTDDAVVDFCRAKEIGTNDFIVFLIYRA